MSAKLRRINNDVLSLTKRLIKSKDNSQTV